MRQAVCGLAVALFSMLSTGERTGAVAIRSRTLLGCSAASGDFVAFLVPGSGIVLLATQEFPGGSPVGTVGDGRLEVRTSRLWRSEPGLGHRARNRRLGHARPHTRDRRAARAASPSVSFGWSSVDDLKTYLHWAVREVLAKHPVRRVGGRTTRRSSKLAERQVTLEVLTPDHRVLHLRGVEGRPSAIGRARPRPRSSSSRSSSARPTTGRRCAFRSSRGAFFGPGVTEEVAFRAHRLDRGHLAPDHSRPSPSDWPRSNGTEPTSRSSLAIGATLRRRRAPIARCSITWRLEILGTQTMAEKRVLAVGVGRNTLDSVRERLGRRSVPGRHGADGAQRPDTGVRGPFRPAGDRAPVAGSGGAELPARPAGQVLGLAARPG